SSTMMMLLTLLLTILELLVQGNIILTQTPGSKSVVQGQTVSIKCKTSSSCHHNSQVCLSWYQQKPGEAPKALIYGKSSRFSGISSRFTGTKCSSALGEFIVLRVEHWRTDSCLS
uniref:Immunoglobulin V-set domain-containing protein n=1 Tax=Cyprinodon variegatus TaxID=28743 RepID=A0A3Q2CG44_CYPVA